MPTKKTSKKAKRPTEAELDDLAEGTARVIEKKLMLDQFKQAWGSFSLKSRAEIELMLAAMATIARFHIAIFTAFKQLQRGKMPSVSSLNTDLLTYAACTYADLRPAKKVKAKVKKATKKRK